MTRQVEPGAMSVRLRRDTVTTARGSSWDALARRWGSGVELDFGLWRPSSQPGSTGFGAARTNSPPQRRRQRGYAQFLSSNCITAVVPKTASALFRTRALEVAAFGRWRGQVVIGDWALGCSGARPHLRLRLSFPHARSFRHQSHSTPEFGRISPWSAETGGSTKDAFYTLPDHVGVLVLLI